MAGKLSHEAFFDLMKRGDYVEADLDFEDEQARIDSNPPMPDPVLGGGNPSDPNNPNPAKPKPPIKE